MNLLFEIGCEEIPHLDIENLNNQLYHNLTNEFKKHAIAYQKIEKFSSPRRLAVLVHNVSDLVGAKEIIKKGPPILAAIKNNVFTPAAQGFIENINHSLKNQEQNTEVRPENIPELETSKNLQAGFYQKKIADKFFLVYFFQTKAMQTKILLRDILKNVLAQFVCDHNMRWDNLDCKFIRPIRWLMALWGNEKTSSVIALSHANIKSNNLTYGHRFLNNNQEITINNPLAYEETLANHHVIANSSKRREKIIAQLQKLEKKYNATALSQTKLINIVNNLVEYPVLLIGDFEEKFLKIPLEVLISEMVEHQKYFPLQDRKTGKLLPHFIITANITEPTQVCRGNNKVIQSRFNDGFFFYQQDIKIGIETLSLKAEKVIYHKDLGYYSEKIKRVQMISELLNNKCYFVEKKKLAKSINLLKADLFSQMVYEFPKLQGIIGEYYINLAGYDADIALAAKEHYYPTTGGGNLPNVALAIGASLADKLDDLLAFLAIGIVPSGSNDPYALRRKTQGLLRILIEKKISLNLSDFIKEILPIYKPFLKKMCSKSFLKNIFDFIGNRLKTTLKDYGFNGTLIEAGLTLNQWNIDTLYLQLIALKKSRQQKYFQEFTTVYKRVINILKKNKSISLDNNSISPNLFHTESEQTLYQFHLAQKKKIMESIDHNDYQRAYENISQYQKPLADFFEHVFVDVEDINVKKNRLTLLKNIKQLMRHLPIA